MNSNILKTEALCWLRYIKQVDLVATEVGGNNADVFGATPNYSVEIETKISIADFRADFRKGKHIRYLSGTPGLWVPNFFYFMIPIHLQEKATAILDEKAPGYGLIVYNEDICGVLAGRICAVVRKAQRLHDGKPRDKLKEYVVARMASEICGMHQMMNRWSADLSSLLPGIHSSILDAVEKTMTQPPEESDGPPTVGIE